MLRFFAVLALAFGVAQAQSITSTALKAHVSFLSSDAMEGRGVGSKGLEIAGEYIASQFRRAGLQPLADDYFQSGDFTLTQPVTEGLSVSFHAGGNTLSGAALAIVNPTAVDLEGLAAVIVNPTQLEALQPADAQGKALVVELSAPAVAGASFNSDLAAAARELQPAVVIVLRNGGRALPSPPRLSYPGAKRALPVIHIFDAALYKAVMEAESGATVSVRVPPPVESQVKLRNVIGVLPGSDAELKDSWVVVSAHYDHVGVRENDSADKIYNGAIDDASGTAAVMEIANSVAALPGKPKRSIAFVAFTAEESGMVGARFFAQAPVFPPSKIVANINLEQIARQSMATTDPALFMTGFSFTNIREYFAGADMKPTDSKESEPFFNRSDNVALAEVGVPSTTFSAVYTFPDYHQPGDEWQKVDYEGMARVTNSILEGILNLANSTDAPRWNTENPKTAPYVKARSGAK